MQSGLSSRTPAARSKSLHHICAVSVRSFPYCNAQSSQFPEPGTSLNLPNCVSMTFCGLLSSATLGMDLHKVDISVIVARQRVTRRSPVLSVSRLAHAGAVSVTLLLLKEVTSERAALTCTRRIDENSFIVLVAVLESFKTRIFGCYSSHILSI